MLNSDVSSTSRLEELVLYSRPDQTCVVDALSRVAARQSNTALPNVYHPCRPAKCYYMTRFGGYMICIIPAWMFACIFKGPCKVTAVPHDVTQSWGHFQSALGVHCYCDFVRPLFVASDLVHCRCPLNICHANNVCVRTFQKQKSHALTICVFQWTVLDCLDDNRESFVWDTLLYTPASLTKYAFQCRLLVSISIQTNISCGKGCAACQPNVA